MSDLNLGGDGIWNDANWGGTKPVDDDNGSIKNPSAAVTMPADEGEIKMGQLLVHRDFEHAVGASASPIRIAAADLLYYGSGGLFFECDHPATADHITDDVLIQAADAGVLIELGCVFNSPQEGTYDKISLARGNLTMTATTRFESDAEIDVGYMTNPADDSILTIAEGASSSVALAKLRMNGGKGFTNMEIADVEICGVGTELTHDKAKIVRGVLKAGSTLNYNHLAISGDATEIFVEAGATLNMMDDMRGKVVSYVRALPGSIIRRNLTLHVFTAFDDFRTVEG